MERWITLTALAQATRRLRVGVLVTGNVHRHLAVLANMAATLDIVSGGRLELGLGAGWDEVECATYGSTCLRSGSGSTASTRPWCRGGRCWSSTAPKWARPEFVISTHLRIPEDGNMAALVDEAGAL